MSVAVASGTAWNTVGPYLREIGRYPLLGRDDEARLGREMMRGAQAQLELRDRDALSPEQFSELRRAVKRADDAKRTFVQSNLRLVVSVAKKYRYSGASLADLIQEGTFGLIRAVEKFDFTMGFKFSTYAVWRIDEAIRRGIAETTAVIRMPIDVHKEVIKVGKTRTELAGRLRRPPTEGEIAAEAGMTASRVSAVLQLPKASLSLDTAPRDGGSALSDTVRDHAAHTPEDATVAAMTAIDVQALLAPLKERERQILIMRFGLDGTEPAHHSAIAERFGISPERIRRIEVAALTNLRHLAEENGARALLGTR